MKDLRQHQTILSGPKGNVSRYSLDSPPPAAHISYKPEFPFIWVRRLLIAARLECMTYEMPESITVLPYRGISSTTAAMAAQ